MSETSSVSRAPGDTKQVAALSWLWEDRAGEIVLPGPLYQKPLGMCRPLPAWEELTRAIARSSVDGDLRSSVLPSPLSHDGSYHAQSISTAAASLQQRAQSSMEYTQPSLQHRAQNSMEYTQPSLHQRAQSSMEYTEPSSRKGMSSRRKHHKGRFDRPASTLTLASAELSCVVPGSIAVWRGCGLPCSLETRQAQNKEFARHRRDCKSERAAQDRHRSRRQREEEGYIQPTVVVNDIKVAKGDCNPLHRNRKNMHRAVRIFDTNDEAQLTSTSPEPILPQISPQSVGSLALELPIDHKVQQVITPKTTNPMRTLQMALHLTALPSKPHNANEHLLEREMLQIDSPKNAAPEAESKGGVATSGEGGIAASKDEATTPRRKGIVQRKQTGPLVDPDDKPSVHHPAFHESDLLKPGSTLGFRRGTTFIVKPDAESPQKKKGSSLLMRSRMRRLLDRRKQEFVSWPSAEQERLRDAFQIGDPTGMAALDSKGLRRAFAGLGLEGRTPQEKEAIAKLAREAAIRGSINFFDFVFQLVPEVEHKLEELRSPKLYAEFQLIDTHGTGRIKEHQCLMALEKHTKAMQSLHKDDETSQSFWKQFVKDFPAYYKARCQGVEQWLDFKGFQILATELDTQRANFQQQLEKRIANQTCLPAQLEKVHAGELSVLKRIFDAHDVADHGNLSVERAMHGLLQCGVAAPVGPLWERMQKAMNEFDGMGFMFKDFLSLINGMREETKTMLKGSLQIYVKQLEMTGAPATITARDVPGIMGELPVCQDCCNNIEDLMSLVEACDKECNDLDVHSLILVICKVAERSRITQREIEAATAKQLGFNAKQVMQLRESFAALTRTGVLGVEEVRLWFKEINPDLQPSVQELAELIEEAAPALAPPINKPHSSKADRNRSESSADGHDDDESGFSSQESEPDEKDGRGVLADAAAMGNIHFSRHAHRASVVLTKLDAVNVMKKAKDYHVDHDRNAMNNADSPRPTIANQHSAAILGLEEDEERAPKTVASKSGATRTADGNVEVPSDRRQSGNAATQTTAPKAQNHQEPTGEDLGELEKDRKEEGVASQEASSALNPMLGVNLLYFDGFMRLISMIMKA